MIGEEKTYYLYRYVRHDENVPFYIGIGTKHEYNSQGYKNKSLKSIYYRAYSKDRNYVCLGITKKTSYDVEIMYETNDLNHIQDKEKEFIKLYGLIYDGSGTLTNLTMGGISFKPTSEYSKRSVYKRKMNNTLYGINSKMLYMYDLNGNFIEHFDCLTGFYKKYGYGDKNGCGISQSIREKVSCCGYFFSFNQYDKLDISSYKKVKTRYPIVKYKDDVPCKIYKSIEDVSKDLNIKSDLAYKIVYKNRILYGFSYRKCNIHELPKLN
jgi:hypothetical protein